MSDAVSTFRALVVYAIILPIAVVLGYALATPETISTVGLVGLVLMGLSLPLLLKWHYPLLFLTWNSSVMLFFLPGRPQVWLVIAFVSFVISIVKRSLSREATFIQAPSVSAPLIFLAIVVLFTAKMTGGIGVAALGSETVGGKRYILLLAGMAGFFAFLGERIPPEKALFYVFLFFLGGVLNVVGSLASVVPEWLYFIFWVFPVTTNDLGNLAFDPFSQGVERFYGLSVACQFIFFFVIARYGLRNLLSGKKWLAAVVLVVVAGLSTLGGFRGSLITLTLVFAFVFFYERLLLSRYTLMLIAAILVGGAVLATVSDKLPLSVQRSVSFLPVKVSPIAQMHAEGSTDWRLDMWRAVLPDVPKYLWLGKGLGITGMEVELTSDLHRRGLFVSPYEGALLAGDYHSGPLTTIIPFGIWGMIGCLWFLIAATRAMFLNMRYGEESLRYLNTLLFALFATKVLMFLAVFGNFNSDMAQFTGIVGLGIAINGGIRTRQTSAQPAAIPQPTFRLRPLKPAEVAQ